MNELHATTTVIGIATKTKKPVKKFKIAALNNDGVEAFFEIE